MCDPGPLDAKNGSLMTSEFANKTDLVGSKKHNHT